MKCVLALLAFSVACVLCTPATAEAKVHRRGVAAQYHAWQSGRATTFALAQRGKPYRWGGTGPRGYDCSGLVQTAYRKAGRRIPRVTHAQFRALRRVKRRQLRPGDLVFFRSRAHVGMWLGRGRFIHSPRTGLTVRVQRMSGYYRRGFAGAVRP